MNKATDVIASPPKVGACLPAGRKQSDARCFGLRPKHDTERHPEPFVCHAEPARRQAGDSEASQDKLREGSRCQIATAGCAGLAMTHRGMLRHHLALCLAMTSVFIFLVFSTARADAHADDLERKLSAHDTSFYRDFFDSILYGRFAQFLRLDQLARHLTFKKDPALDVNRFDEVPDSTFFTNRHGRKRLSAGELKRGPGEGSGPDPKGPWRVTKGKTEGVTAGFFIEDGKGDAYLLKFDPKDNPDMATSAEIISHKFFHAFGYHVAEYYLVKLSPDILIPDPQATYYDENGFKKPLTAEALETLIEKIPKYKGGVLRASASKILPPPRLGYMDFEGRRENDPDDLVAHEDRRSIRALRVFGSWLNHYDLRRDNTMDVVEAVDGKTFVKHYLIDFGSTLGSAGFRPKVPVAGHENIVDWYEIGEGIPTLKLVEKPWERRWDQVNRSISYPEIGYFDNYQFDPGKWKTQLPYEPFQRLTVSDAFWASKIIMSFTDEDIRAIVDTAQYSSPDTAKIVSEILIARRDIIARYWFFRATPLDELRLFQSGDSNYEIRFTDLAVKYGFAQSGEAQYRYRMQTKGGSGEEREFSGSSFSIQAPAGARGDIVLYVSAKYAGQDEWSHPPLRLVLTSSVQGSLPSTTTASLEISEIDHGV